MSNIKVVIAEYKKDNINPFYVAFLNAHGYREPAHYSNHYFSNWMEHMYRAFFREKGYFDVCRAQQEGFVTWLLLESVKPDCYRDEEIMSGEIVEVK
jgi:hypothetical protein